MFLFRRLLCWCAPLAVFALVLGGCSGGIEEEEPINSELLEGASLKLLSGKAEEAINPFDLYLSIGVPFVASTISSKVKDMGRLITDAMNHRGFSIVHIQSPCTTYNDTYEQLKGNAKKGIEPLAWDIPEDHDPSDISAAREVVSSGGVPLGLIYRTDERTTFDQQMVGMAKKAKTPSIDRLLEASAV